MLTALLLLLLPPLLQFTQWKPPKGTAAPPPAPPPESSHPSLQSESEADSEYDSPAAAAETELMETPEWGLFGWEVEQVRLLL